MGRERDGEEEGEGKGERVGRGEEDFIHFNLREETEKFDR